MAITATADSSSVRSTVADILGLRSKSTEDAANSTASTTQATGYTKEAEAYSTAGAISEQNAALADVSGQIKELQSNRKVATTIGSQRADVAAAGFKESGSSLGILRSSLQQGYLSDQLIRSQTVLTQGGYLEEAAASKAQSEGATYASQAATDLAASEKAAGELATASSVNETTALTDYLKTVNPTAESDLAVKTLGLPAGSVASFDPDTDLKTGTESEVKSGTTTTSTSAKGLLSSTTSSRDKLISDAANPIRWGSPWGIAGDTTGMSLVAKKTK